MIIYGVHFAWTWWMMAMVHGVQNKANCKTTRRVLFLPSFPAQTTPMKNIYLGKHRHNTETTQTDEQPDTGLVPRTQRTRHLLYTFSLFCLPFE